MCNNRIHDIMLELSDGGGIYTLGRQPGTVLRGNYISNVPSNHGRAESNGIFMDQGSSGILVQGNVIAGTKCSPMRFHLAGQNTLKENQCFHPVGVEPLKFNNTPKDNIKLVDNSFHKDGLSEASPSTRQ
ncbi:right-handed parallel beta-helix repeat-containing protein [Mariniblastus sp.]|nr:right-handed parallel beta-helix repeat-containing protein [Mariniblastus sp.]